MNDIALAILSSVLTGFLSTGLTVAALKVHIQYLRDHVERHEKAIQRAHRRIDSIMSYHGMPVDRDHEGNGD